MATPTLTPNSKEEQDDRYNPSLLSEQERQAFAGIEDDSSRDADESQGNANIDKAKKGENNPSEIPITGSGSWSEKQPITGRLWGVVRKNSALTTIIGFLLTGAFGLSLLSPSLLLMQFRETLLDKFNDQLTVMDFRQTAILKKKLGRTTLQGCRVTSIRCKYRSLGERHVERLRKAGINIGGDKTTLTGRVKPTSFKYNGESIAASDLLDRARSDPGLRSAMRHGYNPKFAAFSDAIANNVLSNLGLKKSRTITPSSDKDKMKEEHKKAASGDTGLADGEKLTPSRTDENGNVTEWKDSNGKTYSGLEGERINSLIDEINARGELANGITKKAVKAGLKGALTATALGAGSVDTACTMWTIIRIAGFAAKVYGQRQLIRYAYEFLKTPDGLRANAVEPLENQVTPEEVSYFSDILTSVNSEGKSATDSDGYRYAAYGDVFTPGNFDTDTGDKDATAAKNELQNETARYVNGQMIPANAMTSIISAINTVGDGDSNSLASADRVCGFVKSWKGQVALIALVGVGAVVTFFTGGISLGAGTAAAVAVSVAASVAIAAITPKLVDMAKGELINGNENGNEAGNAIVSGVGGFNAQASQGRALAVLDKEDAVAYAQTTETVVADYNEVDRYERGPLDPTSKNTFIGSIASSLLPYTSKMSNGGATITSTVSLVTQSFGNIFTPMSNASETKASEFEVCSDYEYEGLAADPFCNLRYGMSKEALQIDPEVVLDYMEDGDYIEEDSEDGAPGDTNGPKYQEYIDQCIERENSIGDNLTEGDEGSGENCIQGRGGDNEERNTMFRLFYIDTSIQDGMDSDFSVGSESSTGEAGDIGPLNFGSYNILTSTRAATDGNAGYDEKDDARMKAAADLIDKEQLHIVATQEARGAERNGLLAHLPDYYSATKLDGSGHDFSEVVFWDNRIFSEEGMGTFTIPKDGNTLRDAMWVKLKLKGGQGGELYVFNIHTSLDESQRAVGANQTLDAVRRVVGDSGTPYIIAGDMNSNDLDPGRNAVFEVFKASGMLTYARDATTNQKGYNCDTQNGWDGRQDCRRGKGSHLDQIWVSKDPNIKVNRWENIANGDTIKISDHNPVITNLTVPGLGSEADSANIPQPSKDGWVWPVPLVKDLGILPWGASGSGGLHKGIDIGNRSTALGSPVVAAHDGVITKSYGKGDSCGYYVVIKATDTPYWMGYQHLRDTSASTAPVGKAVNAGDVIGRVGRQGGSTCGTAGFFHLHFSVETKNTISTYADPGTNGTINPLTVLPR